MSSPVTVINVIEVDPRHQQEVIDILVDGLTTVISKRPGFLSATVQAGMDGSRVVNIARWKSVEDATATQSDPGAARRAQRVAAVATATPGIFTTVFETH